MDVKHITMNMALIEDVYKIPIEEAKKLSRHKEKALLIEQFGINKRNFLEKEGKPNSITTSVFSELFNYELERKKDVIEFTYDEVLEVIGDMIKRGLFTSESYYNGVLNLLHHYTEWGYGTHLRSDIITIEDVTRKIKYDEVIDKKVAYEKILTKNEMISYIQKCPTESAAIGLQALMEGLRVPELAEIRINEFTSMENHPLQLEKRTVNISDSLYDKMYAYSKENTFIRNYKGYDKEVPFADTGYLYRPQRNKSKTDDSGKLSRTLISQVMMRDLGEAGFNGMASDFRTSSILNDIIDGISIEQINKKYDLKLINIQQARYGSKLKILKEKRDKEMKEV